MCQKDEVKSVDKMENQTPENCVVTYVASPSKFYIATHEMNAEAEQIAESMSEEFNRARATPMKSGKQLTGTDLVVLYHRGKFWRALKLKNHRSAEGVSLFLVDRGEAVVVADLKMVFALDLDHSLREIDPLCVRAHLGDVIPKRSEWSAESIDFFERNVRREDLKAILRGDIEQRDDGEPSMPLELLFTEAFTETPFTPERRIETSMSRLLLREGHATVKDFEDPGGNQTVQNGEMEFDKTRQGC